jgi:hypothetical protein
MAEAITFTNEVCGVICDGCPLKAVSEADWQLTAGNAGVDPISMGMYMTGILRDLRAKGMPEPEEGIEPGSVRAIDGDEYFDYASSMPKVQAVHTRLLTCFQRNAAGECSDAEPTGSRLPELLFSQQTILDGLRLVARTGNEQEVAGMAVRVRNAIDELLHMFPDSVAADLRKRLRGLGDLELLLWLESGLHELIKTDE